MYIPQPCVDRTWLRMLVECYDARDGENWKFLNRMCEQSRRSPGQDSLQMQAVTVYKGMCKGMSRSLCTLLNLHKLVHYHHQLRGAAVSNLSMLHCPWQVASSGRSAESQRPMQVSNSKSKFKIQIQTQNSNFKSILKLRFNLELDSDSSRKSNSTLICLKTKFKFKFKFMCKFKIKSPSCLVL